MTSHDKASGMIPVAVAADTLKTTRLHILMHIRRGRLAGREIEGHWYVTRQSLEDLSAAGPSAEIRPSKGCSFHKGCGSCS